MSKLVVLLLFTFIISAYSYGQFVGTYQTQQIVINTITTQPSSLLTKDSVGMLTVGIPTTVQTPTVQTQTYAVYQTQYKPNILHVITGSYNAQDIKYQNGFQAVRMN